MRNVKTSGYSWRWLCDQKFTNYAHKNNTWNCKRYKSYSEKGGVGWRRALQKGDYILIFVWWPQCNYVYIYETLTMMSVCLRYCHGYWAIFFCCNILCNLICWSPRRWPWEQNEMLILTGIFRSKLEHALRTQPVFLCKLNNTSYVS